MPARPETKKRAPAPAFDRTPPQNIEAERSVLGAMLINNDVIGTAVEILRDAADEVFYVAAHQHIYSAIVELFRKNQPVDSITLVHQLTSTGTLEDVGGVPYIADLTGAVPTSANVEYYAKIVLETAVLRKLITTCSRVVAEA
ncbi:MAG: hypothetical protein IT368_15485, partial [Candidatus Hydrogenedentes bacterium]|nr:hypothetical protein [Candidatus Hydrogenedentota bacterium]